jgi:eukaryotic-like serine/threonine-protein kinase
VSVPDRLQAALSDRYRLERELGAGGMATVYLAQDLKHDRQVALKVLKPELAAVLGAERFVIEIKTTAALQHPHILPLFDSGTADGFLYYVMPFIQGETLRTKLDREHQFGVEEAVRITREVADALDYAHRNGVIHRDIKPENILLHDGRPMVADFGIALALSAAAGGRMTETGLSLGTPHYMSPEQATAEKEISGRSDVYSLASVLYEMLTGEPPHTGKSAQQIIMKIIAEPVKPVAELRKSVPRHVAAAVAQALEKLPADRFESAKAFADALTDSHFTTVSEAAAAGASGGSVGQWLRSPFSRAAVALLVVSSVVLAVLATRDQAPPMPEPVVAFPLVDSIGAPLTFALADDGTMIFVRDGQIFVRRPGELTESALSGVDDAVSGSTLVISPNGADLVYEAERGSGPSLRSVLQRASLRGGAPSTLWTAPEALTYALPLAWSEDGSIYVTVVSGSLASARLGRLRESGGEIETISEAAFNDAVLLPGGRALVGCVFTSSGPNVVALDLTTRDTVHVAPDACSPRWSPTGHLLLPNRDGTLRALPFDPDRLEVTGPSTPVLSGVAVANTNARYQLSRTGTLMYVAGPPSGGGAGLQMTLIDLDGTASPIPLERTDHADAGFSPDGRMLAYTREGHIWIYDLDLGTHRKLTTVGSEHHNPVWSPDGAGVAYRALRTEGNGGDVYVQALDGDSVGVHIGGTAGGDNPSQWLSDGTILVYQDPPSDIVTLNADRPGAPVPILQADWNETRGRVSPDGKWLAYQSNEAGRGQLIVRAWPRLDRKAVIADSIAAQFHFWSPDNRTLYYVRQGNLMAAALAGTDSLSVLSRRVAVERLGGSLAAMHPDGRRFLVFRTAASQAADGATARRSLVVVTGWLTVLRQRLADGVVQ